MILRPLAISSQNFGHIRQFWVSNSSKPFRRNREVRIGANAWKHATEQQIVEIRKTAQGQGGETQGTFGDMRARSKATAFEMWERSEPLREGARDVGEGLVRAWAELRASIGKAANRLSASEAPGTRPADEHRESS